MRPRRREKSNGNRTGKPARGRAAPVPAATEARSSPARSGDTEARFRSTFNQAAVGIAHTTTDGRILEVNRMLCEMLGYSAAELLAVTTRDLTHPDDRDRQDDMRHELLAGTRSHFSGDKRYLRKDGSVLWVNRTVTLARETPDGEPYLIQTIDSINQRKLAEDLLARASRARRVLAACSHILVHATDETEMLEDMCRVVVEPGGYKMAWVGLATSDPTRPVYPAAYAGFRDDAPMTGAPAWSADGRYQGFMHSAITTGEPHIARDILNDPRNARRRERAIKHGFQSSIALPLKSDDRILGAIAIYAAEADAFDVEEIGLLTELTNDIAYGINNLRTRIAREQAEQRSRENERRFREMFDQIAVGITRVDLDGILVDVNQKFCDMLGYARDELLGKTVKDVTHPDDYGSGERYRAQLTRDTAKPVVGEKRFVRKNGTIVWTRRTISTALDDAGDPLYLISVIEDITGSKELEWRFQETFDQAAVGIVHTSLDGRYLQVNRKFCEMLGYGESELAGRTAADFTHPEDRDKGREYRQLMWDGRLDKFTEQKRYLRKDGGVLWTNRTVSLARNAAGEPLYFIRVIEDITERREMEERYRATFDNAPVGIMHTAIDTYKILHVNPKLCEMLGYTRDELLTMTSTDVVHPEHRFTDVSKYKDPMLNGKARSFASERKFVRKDGSSFWANRTVSLARDAAGEPLYFIRIVEDITERKQAEEMMARERALLRTIINALPDYIYVKDRAGSFLLANKAWLAARGEQDEDIAGKTVFDYFPREVAEKLAAQDLGIVKTGIPLPEFEQKLIVKSRDAGQSEERWASTTKVPLRTAAGDTIGTVGISRDITEQKQSAARRAMEHAVTRVLAESPTLAGAMPKIIRTMCEAMGWAYGARWAWDEGEQRLCRAEYWCESEPEFDPADREQWLKVANTGSGRLLRRAWIDKKATWLANLHDDKPFRRRASVVKLGWRSAYAFPIQIGNDVIGVMEFFGPDRRGPDEALMQVTGSIGSQIGQFVQRKQAEEALRVSEETFRVTFSQASVGIAVTTPDLRYLQVNDKYASILGYTRDEIMALTVKDAVGPQGMKDSVETRQRLISGEISHVSREKQLIGKDGAPVWTMLSTSLIRHADGAPKHFITIVQDISERKQAEEQLLHLAHYDVLTNLPNRALFYDRLKQALAQAKRNQWVTGVMFMDVDRFKNVNDTLGHAVGDLLLQQVSERLVCSVRSGDTVGRLGGDEFSIVLSNLTSAQDASLVAQKIMANFNEPFRLEGADIFVTASIGITLYPEDSIEQDALIKNADAAMYKAKEAGRNNYQFYTPEMNARGLALLNLEGSLRRALERDEFLLHFQPKANIASGEITGFEALLRWNHPERGLVPPAEFIPVMEETGLIVPAGEWVLNAVCTQIKQWKNAGVKTLPVAVNLSARQFLMRDLGPTIKRILEERRVDPRLLELEITESSLMVNPEEAARTLGYLKSLGVRLSIDDFGTGYSSLGYLKRFPLDALKIDSSFVRDVTTNPDDATITRAVISMAHSLGLKVIAEGVEIEPQLAFLTEYGCDEIQGYYFARPMPAVECAAWLTQGRLLERLTQLAGPGTQTVLGVVPRRAGK